MGEKRESEEFEDEDADEAVESDDPDIEHLIKDLETQKRRGGPKGGEPAWRRLEKYMEQKRTAELLSDFDDYDVGDGLDADDDDSGASSDDLDDDDLDDDRAHAREARARKRAR